jgi:hypothetical protein
VQDNEIFGEQNHFNGTPSRTGPFQLQINYVVVPEVICQSKSRDALRTYATWLVRAARRKMAVSGPENTPGNKAELT